jgi:hypothetical protein
LLPEGSFAAEQLTPSEGGVKQKAKGRRRELRIQEEGLKKT